MSDEKPPRIIETVVYSGSELSLTSESDSSKPTYSKTPYILFCEYMTSQRLLNEAKVYVHKWADCSKKLEIATKNLETISRLNKLRGYPTGKEWTDMIKKVDETLEFLKADLNEITK